MNVIKKLISVEMAYKLLEGNTHNRELRAAIVAKYARDMKAGRWMLSHVAIAFDPQGTLLDGQHRLWAVIEANTPIWFMVAYDVDPATRSVIDCGLIRDDQARLNLGYGMKVSKTYTAMAKRLLRNRLPGKATTAELYALIAEHHNALDFSEKCFTRTVRAITTVPIYAVLARASYHAEQDALRHFAEVLQDGKITDASDDAALLLRNYLLERAPRQGGEAAIYAKTERALFAYLHREKLTTLYSAAHELFPLPEEQTTRKRACETMGRTVKKVVVIGKKLPTGRAKKARA